MENARTDRTETDTLGPAPGTPDSVDAVLGALESERYVADRGLATAIFLALRLPKPLLLEGEAGVGKTEVAKTLAAIAGAPLIRLQCYEGLDVSHAVYEWDYSRQMLHIRLMEARGAAREAAPADLFGPQFLIKRPLLQAIETTADGTANPVLLIDELDRADDEFDAFTTPSSGAASTTGSTTPPWRRRCRSWRRASRGPRSASPARSAPSSRPSAGTISGRCRASPRPWTGPPPCWRSASRS
jgi:hypothetical protein